MTAPTHTTAPVPPGGSRPRPILLAQSILAAVGLIVGSAGFAERVPADAAWWVVTGLAAVNLGLGFYLQSRTTPLSDPRDASGTPLVAADVTRIVVTRDDAATVTTPMEPRRVANPARMRWTEPPR
jgi:hypothetical protein